MKFLAGYKKIATEDLIPALKVAIDFAAFTGRNVREATYAISYAATGQLGMLREYGFTFSEATQQSKNFKDILAEMAARVSGQEAAKMETYSGAVGALAKAFNRVEKAIGHVLEAAALPVIKDMIGFFKEIGKEIETAFKSGGTEEWQARIQGALQSTADFIKDMVTGLVEFARSGGLERLMTAFTTIAAVMQSMALVAGKVLGVLVQLPSPVLYFVGALAGLSLIVKLFKALWGGVVTVKESLLNAVGIWKTYHSAATDGPCE